MALRPRLRSCAASRPRWGAVAKRVTRALLDTSVVIAGADAVALASTQAAAISVITLGELRAGVRLAADAGTRAVRQARLAAICATFDPLAVDETVVEYYGELLATARSQRRASKATDPLIIATAAASGRVLHTLHSSQPGLARPVGVPSNPDDQRAPAEWSASRRRSASIASQTSTKRVVSGASPKRITSGRRKLTITPA
jgi:predicted nucleic acid-binding protein